MKLLIILGLLSVTLQAQMQSAHILSKDFYMPELDRHRQVRIYLPPDYATSTKHYPVLYMHDGQNLFEDSTAFAGEWEVDETLNRLFEEGDYGAIVVGIDNGGSERINELTPWVNVKYGGGKGDKYMQFVVETLKPYVDSTFRTKPQAEFTALAGSSLGALISVYGGVSYPHIFANIGSLSPAYWIVSSELNEFITNSCTDLSGICIYTVGSLNESESISVEITKVQTGLRSRGLKDANAPVKLDSYGQHNETYWRGEFEAFYKWFVGTSTNTDL